MSDRYCYDHPRPALTVDVALFRFQDGSWQILLIRRRKDPFGGKFALPGGFVDEREPLDQAARRELAEETGLTMDQCHQLRAYGEPGRDPRGHTVSVVYCAITSDSTEARGRDDASEAKWFDLHAVPNLAFDHDQIVKDSIEWLRCREEYSSEGETDS